MHQPAPVSVTAKVRDELRNEVEALRMLRDEIRLKLHLGGMEAKSTWQDLEKQLEQLEERLGHEGDHVVDTAQQLASELRESFRQFRQRLM